MASENTQITAMEERKVSVGYCGGPRQEMEVKIVPAVLETDEKGRPKKLPVFEGPAGVLLHLVNACTKWVQVWWWTVGPNGRPTSEEKPLPLAPNVSEKIGVTIAERIAFRITRETILVFGGGLAFEYPSNLKLSRLDDISRAKGGESR